MFEASIVMCHLFLFTKRIFVKHGIDFESTAGYSWPAYFGLSALNRISPLGSCIIAVHCYLKPQKSVLPSDAFAAANNSLLSAWIATYTTNM